MTFVHMHDGETVYYDDTCYVCEAEKPDSTNDAYPELTPHTASQIHAEICGCDQKIPDWPEEVPKPARKRPMDIYDVREYVRTAFFAGLAVGAWELAIILGDLITNGTVHW